MKIYNPFLFYFAEKSFPHFSRVNKTPDEVYMLRAESECSRYALIVV